MKRIKFRGLPCSVIILFGLLLSLFFAENAYAVWNISTIATPTGTTSNDTKGTYSSIGIDSKNKAHISYMNKYSGGSGTYSWDLYYITNFSGLWEEISIANSSNIAKSGNFASLAVDNNNKVHISNIYEYQQFNPQHWDVGLSHNTNISGIWVSETALSWPTSTYPNNTYYSSVKTDSNNAVHIGCVNPVYATGLIYATNSSGSWVKIVVDPSSSVGSFVSIAVDSNNKAHMSYYDSDNSALKYATNSSGSWVVSTLDNNGVVGNFTSIAVDLNNKVHISYYDLTNGAIKYATDTSGIWVTHAITSDGYSPSIAVDSYDHVHISFNNNSKLHYATNTSGSWTVSIVDGGGDAVGEYSSIAVDSIGTVHISYYAASHRSLKYAYGVPDTIIPDIRSLTVSKSGTGGGSVDSYPTGISCGETCSASFGSGSSVTLKATSDSGSTFIGWTGDCSGTGTCTVTMGAVKNVGAVFNLETDGWGSWSAVNSGLTNTSVQSLAVDPSTPQTLYAGTLGGVFKSVNGGGWWNGSNTGLTSLNVWSLAIDRLTPQTVYAGTLNGGGVFKSVNGGDNWSAFNTGLTNKSVRSLAIDPLTPQILFAGTEGGGVFKSVNGGGDWIAINTGLTNTNIWSLAIDPITPQTIFAGTRGEGVFKSVNGGESWVAFNTGMSNTSVSSLAIDPSNPQTIFAGISYGGGIFKSVNSGGSWSAVNSGLTQTYVLSLAIVTSQTIYAGTYAGGVFNSIDGGESWSAVDGLTNEKVYSLAIAPSIPPTVYGGLLGGVFKTQSEASVSATGATLTPTLASPQLVGSTTTFSAAATGGDASPYEYRFWWRSTVAGSTWAVGQNYSPSPIWSWNTAALGLPAGSYYIQVDTRHVGNTAKSEAIKSLTYKLVDPVPPSSVTLTSNIATPQTVGSTVTFTAKAIGGDIRPYEYRFWWRSALAGSTWTMAQAYSTSTTWSWNSASLGLAAGSYYIQVDTRHVGNTAKSEMIKSLTYKLVVPVIPATGVLVTTNVSTPQTVGTTVTFTGQATGGDAGPYEYRFWWRPTTTGATWTVGQGYSTDVTWDWNTATLGLGAGSYFIQVDTRHVGSTVKSENKNSMSYILN